MTQVSVRIPSPLRNFTSGADEVVVNGGTIGEVLACLGQEYPDLRDRVLDERGELRSFVNIFLDQTSVRDLEGLATPVEEGAVVAIVPAVAGGVI